MTEDRKTGYSQSGTSTCYQAEYLKYKIVDGVAEEDWVPIKTSKKFDGVGVPSCRLMGDLFSFVGYQSYEQANALCWWALANWEAKPYDRNRQFEARPRVRIRVYDFIYDIKTYCRDEDNILIGPSTRNPKSV
jgi:hypothetical protein